MSTQNPENPEAPESPEAGKSGAFAEEQPSSEHDRHAHAVDGEEPPRLPFPVVGIGASAGGLEAALELFESMPSDSGMAFVLVQHLPPDRDTLIPEILAKKTSMPVQVVKDGMPIEPNHVYVIRPGRTLTIREGHLHLGEPLEKPMRSRPVDDFFRSLAEEQRERAIAIVLSGMGSNGTGGAEAVKAVGGLCIAQDPDSAAFPSMPRHMIDDGSADYILRPGDMPETLLAYAGHPYARDRDDPDATFVRERQNVNEILALLRTRTHHDFAGYKSPTVLRRIQRRMGLARVTKVADYARVLRQTPSEVTALADDLLINVTGFFRDPEAWEALRTCVVAPLVEAREDDSTIRAWVTACSTGQEAYTLAMLLVEEVERTGKNIDIKIFATDMADRTLANARQGVYPGGIESEITPERLERFFQREDSVYRVRPDLRARVVFAPQNVLRDPPFSRLDIVTCRNLLIYLQPELQQRVLGLLHFGLRDGGALFLGSSETVGAGNLFDIIDKRARIFRRVGPSRHGAVEFQLSRKAMAMYREPSSVLDHAPIPTRLTLGQLTMRALLEHHVTGAVTIDREFRILYYHGNTSPFLRQPAGEPTRDLIAVVRDTVRGAVRAAVQRAAEQTEPIVIENAWIERENGARTQVAVTVSRIESKSDGDSGFVVSFRELGLWPPPQAAGYAASDDGEDSLRRLREELQTTIDQLQASNEELKVAHEEVVSTNEELQSTNEELETSREEMQSLNEELSTVNSQLQAKMEEYQSVNNDLTSLLTSTDIAVLFLDRNFRIRRFTPRVVELLDVIATDIGRPLSDLARKFDDPTLFEDAAGVLERLVPAEREVRVDIDRWFVRRVTPYRTAENRIDGVVITFSETTARRDAEDSLRRGATQFRRWVQGAPVPVVLQAQNGEVLDLSSAWTELTGYGIDELPSLESWLGFIVGPDADRLRNLFRQLFGGVISEFDAEFAIRTKRGSERHWLMRAALTDALAGGQRVSVAIAADVSTSKDVEKQLQESKNVVEAASAMKDLFLANISHELRTPLSVILMWSKLLTKAEMTVAERGDALDAMAHSAESLRRLVDDLLDSTHIASGKLRVSRKPTELNRIVASALDSVRAMADRKQITLVTELGEPSDAVLGDAGRLEQIVWILLTNAVKFTPKGGTVEIATMREDEMVVLRVRDNGPGIAPDFLPKIFQPFTQAEGPKTSKSGLGLGLSIARSLVQLHEGTIAAISDGPGKGATFTVRLPRFSRRPERSDGYGAESSPQTLSGVTVLLVDDFVDSMLAIRAALESAGARVEAVADPLVALQSFRSVAPHVVISDLSMPELNGLELLERIRRVEQEESLAPTRAIALTALATGSDRAAAMASGFDAFLAKPIDPETLIAETHALIHSARV